MLLLAVLDVLAPAGLTRGRCGIDQPGGDDVRADGVESPLNDTVNVFVNYSYQAEPEPEDFDIAELNLPEELEVLLRLRRMNAGTRCSTLQLTVCLNSVRPWCRL